MQTRRWTAWGVAGFALVLLCYVASYAAWSRSAAWRSGKHWAFYTPPRGLINLDVVAQYRSPGLTLEEGWRKQERFPGLLYRPCILIDDALTGNRYLPMNTAAVCFN